MTMEANKHISAVGVAAPPSAPQGGGVPSLRWLEDNYIAWIEDESGTPYSVWLRNAMLTAQPRTDAEQQSNEGAVKDDSGFTATDAAQHPPVERFVCNGDAIRCHDGHGCECAMQGQQPPAEAHCATCDCVPGMTPAIRFDITPAEREGEVRDHLIRMGWTPPAEAQAQGGGDDGMLPDALVPHADKWYRLCERRFAVDRITISGELAEAIVDAINAKASPPSAPVGVDGPHLRYFAYDGDNNDYNEFDTLAEAIASAQESLSYAGDGGWPDGGPSIYYGTVLGEAREIEGSRRAPGPHDNHGFDVIVEYEMTDATALAPQPASCGTCREGIRPDALTGTTCACAQQPAAVDGARTLDEWHEDYGPVVWWKVPVDEPAWIGTPIDSDWPGYHTHWTPHPPCPPDSLAGQQQGNAK